MKTIKTIFTTEFDVEEYLEIFLESNEMERETYENFADVYEEDILKFAYDNKQIEYRNEIANITSYQKIHGEKMYVIKASLGLWNGTFDGGKVVTGMDGVVCACSEEIFSIVLIGKQMKIIASHHDGTNVYLVKELTPEGERFYKNKRYILTDREIVESLFNDRHKSRHVTIWHNMYGL